MNVGTPLYLAAGAALLLAACGSDDGGTGQSDAVSSTDVTGADGVSTVDGDVPDSTPGDAGDGGGTDTGPMDSGTTDGGTSDGSPDGGPGDTDPVDGEGQDTSAADADTSPQDIDQLPDVPTGFEIRGLTLDDDGYCPGASATLSFELVEPPPGGVTLVAQLSDDRGSFFEPIELGRGDFSESGSLSFDFPSGNAFAGDVRVRVVLAGTDSSRPDGIPALPLPAPLVDVFFFDSYATVNTNHQVSNDTEGAVSISWEFGDDAVPATSTEAEPRWTYTTTGLKDITVTAEGANGCERRETFAGAVDVLGCDRLIGPGATPERGTGGLDGRGTSWVCDGASKSDGGGRRLVLVEPGGAFNYTGGGSYGAIVRAGGTFTGREGIALVYETGATLGTVPPGSVECPVVSFDTTNAPADGCTAPGAGPVVVSLSDTDAEPYCAGNAKTLTFASTPAPGAGNRYLVQLSNADGSFSAAPTVGELASESAAGTIDFDLPASIDVEGEYYVRVLTTNPPSVGPAFGPLSVSELATPTFSASTGVALADEQVTFSVDGETAAVSYLWDFGPGATPATSTDAAPVVSWSSGGSKSVTLTISGADGCEVSTTLNPVYVVACDMTLPANTRTIKGTDPDVFRETRPMLICPGAAAEFFSNPSVDVFVASGGSLDWGASGGSSRIFMQDGSLIDGPSFQGAGHTVLLSPTTIRANLADMRTIACPAVTFNTDAIATQCPDVTVPDSAVIVESLSASVACPGTNVEVTFGTEGLFLQSSRFFVELSDATGSFDSPVALGDTRTVGALEVMIPNNTPAGDGYRIRVRSASPSEAGESAATISVPSRPTAAFSATPGQMLEGTTVNITNTSTGAVSWDWDFGAGSSPATSNAENPGSIVYNTAGEKMVRLTVTNAGGCSNTTTRGPALVYSCNPQIPADSELIRGTVTGDGGGRKNVRVCDDGSYGAGGGSYTIFVEPGGTYTRSGGGSYTVYVADGANFVSSSAGSTTVIRAPGANITGNTGGVVFFDCPTLTFDGSVAGSCD
jgi:PKD repeat protein